jgi:hypothetical protein
MSSRGVCHGKYRLFPHGKKEYEHRLSNVGEIGGTKHFARRIEIKILFIAVLRV